MTLKKDKKILLIMPPFWDPTCPPQGIVSLKSYLDSLGYEVQISDFNIDGHLFALQRKYFDIGISHFPHWNYLNINRNGPRYFARHQLIRISGFRDTKRYDELIQLIVNFDGKSNCPPGLRETLDSVIEEIFSRVARKTTELMERFNPDVVGCTMLESTFPSALLILKKAKEMKPGVTTLLGGPGVVTGNMVDDGNLQRISKKCPWIDVIIYGEGEQLLAHYLKGSFNAKRIITIDDLKGITIPDGQTKSLLDLNEMPVSNYEGLPAMKYLWLSIFTSRGCPFKCSFCYEKNYWVRFRKKKVEKVIDEMKSLSKRYGRSKLFYLCDSLANHIATPLSETLIAREEKIKWDCYMRITSECLDEKKVDLWARGGMERARIGVESGSLRVLKLMNKEITPEQIEIGLSNFANSGICTSTLWIAGFPGESDENFGETLKFLRDNHSNIYQADIWEFIAMPKAVDDAGSGDSDFSTMLSYPEEFDDLLIIKYYDLATNSFAPERFEKIAQFEKVRMDLGIPNPYSLKELMDAQKRWSRLGHGSQNR